MDILSYTHINEHKEQEYNSDIFFNNVYRYFEEKGHDNILLRYSLHLCSFILVIILTTFFIGCIDYTAFFAIDSNNPTSLYQIIDISLLFTSWQIFVLVFAIIGCIFFLVQIMSVIYKMIELKNIHHFYTHELNINDEQLQNMTWNAVVTQIQQWFTINGKTAPSAHHIASRIMRRDNYLIALFNNSVLNINIPIPSCCKPLLSKMFSSIDHIPFLSTSLEWNIQRGIFDMVFDEHNILRPNFIGVNPENDAFLVQELSKRFFYLGIINLIFMPFILVYLIVNFLFTYGEQFYHQPEKMSTRKLSLYYTWKLREYNELTHTFLTRQQRAIPYVAKYFQRVPPSRWTPILRFITFILSSFFIIFVIMSFANDNILLGLTIFDRNILNYIGILGICIAICSSLTQERKDSCKLPKYVAKIREELHYIPTEWIEGAKETYVQNHISHIYEYEVIKIAKELAGVFVNPFIIWFSLHHNSKNIILFIKEHSTFVPDLGYICSYADFDKYLIESTVTELSDEKLQKSIMNFSAEFLPHDIEAGAQLHCSGLEQSQNAANPIQYDEPI